MRVHFADSYIINPQHKVTINLVGIGGTGSKVLQWLARLNETLLALRHPGIHVKAWDNDIVSEANIGRQLYSTADIGANKAVVQVTRLNRFYGYEWEAEDKIYTGAAATQRANITITCIDTVAGRLEIGSNISRSTQGVKGIEPTNKAMYWLDFGNAFKTGQVVLGTVRDIPQPKSKHQAIGKLKTVTRLFPQLSKIKDTDSGPSCSLAEAISKQDLCINSTLAELGCALLWKLFREGMIVHHGLYLNLETMTTNPIRI